MRYQRSAIFDFNGRYFIRNRNNSYNTNNKLRSHSKFSSRRSQVHFKWELSLQKCFVSYIMINGNPCKSILLKPSYQNISDIWTSFFSFVGLSGIFLTAASFTFPITFFWGSVIVFGKQISQLWNSMVTENN